MNSDNYNVVSETPSLYKGKALNLSLVYFIKYLKAVFTIDIRSLALLRIGIAATVLLDLSIRASDLSAHYSNSGVIPLSILFKYTWTSESFSIHAISGLWQVQLLLFVLSAFSAICLMAGYKTKWFAFLTWFFLTSLQNRNPFILQGGDDLLRMILFWGIFLPWNRKYSIDYINKTSDQNSYLGLAGIAYLLQICFLYIFSALLKNSPEWKTEGTAIYYALSLDQMVFPFGKYLYNFPELLKYLTHFVFYIELLAPFLFFIPFYTTFFRLLGILLIVSLHIGISLTLFVGIFFIIGIVTLFGLIPGRWVNKLDNKVILFGSEVSNLFQLIGKKINEKIKIQAPLKWEGQNRRLSKIVREGFLIFCLLFVFSWNLRNLGISTYMTEKLEGLGRFIRLDQNWGMFAPTVFKDDGWYILNGTTIDNKQIDLNQNGKELSFEKPSSVVSLFKNDRWRKYSENYLFIANSFMRPYYSNYIFEQWNKRHPEKKIKRLEVIYMKEVTKPDYKVVKPQKEILAITETKNDGTN